MKSSYRPWGRYSLRWQNSFLYTLSHLQSGCCFHLPHCTWKDCTDLWCDYNRTLRWTPVHCLHLGATDKNLLDEKSKLWVREVSFGQSDLFYKQWLNNMWVRSTVGQLQAGEETIVQLLYDKCFSRNPQPIPLFDITNA